MAVRVGLIDVDAEYRGKVTFPNIALMKISAWHKQHGDSVEWYTPLLSGHMDRVYPKSEQVPRCGNAVCPPIPTALVRANLPELCEEVGR